MLMSLLYYLIINSIYAWNILKLLCIPSSWEAYSDRQLTTNFELWVEIFVIRHVSIWGLQNCVRLCFRTPRKKTIFVNISPTTLVIDTSMERFSWVATYYSMETQNFDFFQRSSKLNFDCQYLEKRNRPGFINISPTFGNDTSMEWSSQIPTAAW